LVGGGKEMKRRMLILAPVVLGLLCTMVIGVQTTKADMTYDLNQDGIVNIKDIVYVAAAFGSRLDGPRWNSVSDLDGNGIVNIRDIVAIAIHFGEMST